MAPAGVLFDSLDAGGEIVNILLGLNKHTVGVALAISKALLRCTVPYTICAMSSGPSPVNVYDSSLGRVIVHTRGDACSHLSASFAIGSLHLGPRQTKDLSCRRHCSSENSIE